MAHYCISSGVQFPDSLKNKEPLTFAHEESPLESAKKNKAAESKEEPVESTQIVSDDPNEIEADAPNDSEDGTVEIEKADIEMKNDEDDDEEDSVDIRGNWCRFGFIDQHYNPKPLVVPSIKGTAFALKK